MGLVANSLFEITAPDGTTIGFAACETEVDALIWKHCYSAALAVLLIKPCANKQAAVEAVADEVERLAAGYKVVRVG
jgi:hypothetical protein